jgi:uncharacterized protein Veg
MLKYGEYITEQNKSFKKGDVCTYIPSSSKPYFNKYKGEECEIVHDFNNGNYTLKTKSGNTFLAEETEMTSPKVQAQLTQNQQSSETPHNPVYMPNFVIDIVPGTRVSVTGKEGRVEYTGHKGTVTKVNPNAYLIDFDEDDSRNQRAFSSLVNKDLVTAIDEPSVPVFKTGDKVKCVDNTSKYFDREGEVERIWDDGECMVLFNINGGIEGMPMKPHQIKVVEYVKSKETGGFKKNIPVASSGPVEETDVKIITTEEEEDDDEEVSITSAPFKKSDLQEFSYTDFLLEEKITNLESTLANKAKFEEALKSPDIPEFKKIFIERSLRTAEIVESYFNFLVHKIANGLPVLRTLEQIDNEDLLKNKTKVRASDSKELTRKYSFDQGIIAYWKFKDAVVFKTI